MIHDVGAAGLYARPVRLNMVRTAVPVPVLDLEAPDAVCNPFKKTPVVPRAVGAQHNSGFVGIKDLEEFGNDPGQVGGCEHVILPVSLRSVMSLAEHLAVRCIGRSATAPGRHMVGVHFIQTIYSFRVVVMPKGTQRAV